MIQTTKTREVNMNETNSKQINWDAITCLIVDDDKNTRLFFNI